MKMIPELQNGITFYKQYDKQMFVYVIDKSIILICGSANRFKSSSSARKKYDQILPTQVQ